MSVDTSTTSSSGSDPSNPADRAFAQDDVHATTLGGAFSDYVARVKGGDLGSLPAISGLIVLFVIFSVASDAFTTKLNLANLITQAAPISVLAMGLVLILLLGEIDLGAGVAGSTGAAVTALLIVDRDINWVLATIAGLLVGVLLGAVVGGFMGLGRVQ